ncbi:MAG: ABC transporter permease [Dehalococcoidia bacterium]
MTGYAFRRILVVFPVLWAVATITFLLMHAIPGGPFTQDKDIPEAIQQNLNQRYGLDKSLPEQYGLYLWNISHGDLGFSIQYDRDVTDVLSDSFFVTVQFGVMAILLALVVGLTLGTLSALNHNGPLDYLGVAFATLGASVPHFILATFLSIIFAVNLGWLKIVGWGGPPQPELFFDSAYWDWRKVIIPVIALAGLPAAYIARVTRAAMLEVLNQDYIRTARAKGLSETRVVFRHTVKNALIPVLTVVGPLSAALLTGSFILESMFLIPGVGRLFIDSIGRRDYSLIMGVTLLYTVIIIMANLVVDLMYAVVDPRIRYR